MKCIKAVTAMSQGFASLRTRLGDLSVRAVGVVLLASTTTWLALDVVYDGAMREQRSWTMLFFGLLLVAVAVHLMARVERVHHIVERYAQRLGIPLPDFSRCGVIERLHKRLERLSEEVVAENYALEYQARHDSLTNLPNRSLFLERLESELLAAQEANETIALFIMDLDQFKEVNDTLGHHIGDRLLQEVSRRLVSVLRHTDTVARLGGDEFAVRLPRHSSNRSRLKTSACAQASVLVSPCVPNMARMPAC